MYKEIPLKYLSLVIKVEEFFHGMQATALESIPKDYIIEKCSVVSPLGTDGKFKDLKFTKLGSAVFGNPVKDGIGAVRFDYHNDNGYEYWNIVTNRVVRKGETLTYNANEESPSFADSNRM